MTPTDRPRCYRADMTLTPPSAERISRLRSCAERGAPRRPEGGRREATATVPNPAHPLPSDLSRRRVGALVGARKILSPVSVSQSVSHSVGRSERNQEPSRLSFMHALLPHSPLPRDVSGPFPPSNCSPDRLREREWGDMFVWCCINSLDTQEGVGSSEKTSCHPNRS